MQKADDPSISYRAYIDGLRAIAVLGVLFFHADLGFPGGYIGVDVFFVISGYLITKLILRDLDTGKFSIPDFWERRVRRIFPALSVVVIACLLAGWLVLMPVLYKSLGASAIAQALMVANVYFRGNTGYFNQSVDAVPLLHTWSLAVEEQFYLFFPLLLMILRKLPRPILGRVVLMIGMLSFALSVYFSYTDKAINFYLLPTRAWELLIGSYLAVRAGGRASQRGLAEAVSWGGLSAILLASWAYDSTTRFPGASAVLPCLGTAAIIWANERGPTLVGKLLSLRPLVFVGLISYSLYLWHWPILVFAKYWNIYPLSTLQSGLLLLASILIAVLSWRFIETPFRKRSICRTRARIFSFSAVVTVLILGAGAAIRWSNGVPSRIPASALRHVEQSKEDYAEVQKMSYQVGLKEAVSQNFIPLGIPGIQQAPRILLWGDSHAVSIIPLINDLCEKYQLQGVAAVHASTPPLLGYHREDPNLKMMDPEAFNQAVFEYIRTSHIDHVILAAKWQNYSPGELIHQQLIQTLKALEATGADIWIVRQVPKPAWNVPWTIAQEVKRGHAPESVGIPRTGHLRKQHLEEVIFGNILTTFPKTTILDPTECFDVQNDRYAVIHQGEVLFCDDSHLSKAGAKMLTPLFDPLFRKAAAVDSH